jgi:hypothetical protein
VLGRYEEEVQSGLMLSVGFEGSLYIVLYLHCSQLCGYMHVLMISNNFCELNEQTTRNRVQSVGLRQQRVSVLNIIITKYQSLDCVLHRYMQSATLKFALRLVLFFASFRNGRFCVWTI